MRSSCGTTINYGHVTCHVTKNWKWSKLANWWRIYFLWINKLAFLIEDKQSLLSTFEMNVQWTPPPASYDHLGNTVTSLLRPLFSTAWQKDHTFSCKKKNLVNTANFFFGPLVTVLMGFHCTCSLRPQFFNWNAMDSHSKREVLELLNMNKNNVIAWFFVLNPSSIWQLFTNQPTLYLHSKMSRLMSSLCVHK